MTLKLLGAAPSGTTDAATKSYVDTSTTPGNTGLSGGAGSNLLAVAGAGITISSGIALASTVAGNGLTFTSGVVAVTAAAGAGITVNADDIAVDYGPDPWKKQVRVATTAAGTLATSFANAQVVDGVTLATGDRILLKDQATGSENGIYTVNASGAPTRATDFDATAEAANGCVVEVLSGTINAQTFWNLSNTTSPTIGTTALTFALLSSARQFALNSYSADRTADNTDGRILIDASGASRTVTLPTAVGRKGDGYTIARTDSTTANTATVATTSSQTINGATTYTRLWAQYAYVQVVSDGANWVIVDESNIPEPWQAATLASAQWAARGAGFPVLSYRRLPGGKMLQFIGDVKWTSNGTTGLTSGTAVTTAIPAAYRPATQQHGSAYIAGGSGVVAANTTPLVSLDTAGVLSVFGVTVVTTNGTNTTLEMNIFQVPLDL